METNKFFDEEFLDCKIGFEFEFLRSESITPSQIKKELEKLCAVSIKLEKEHHSAFVPTATVWKIEPDNSVGELSCELITGALPYVQARLVLMRVLGFLRENNKNVSTTEKCGLHLNVSYKNSNYIQNINLLSFILDFDEDLVYSKFPNRKDNIYTKSIKEIIPLHANFDFNNISMSTTNFIYPKTKYYGINFEKLKKGYLEFRYLGGENYENKQTDILYLLDYFLYSLKQSYYNKQRGDVNKLKAILEPKKNLFIAGKSVFNFKNIFKNITLLVDTNDNYEILKSFYPQMWQVIFDIFIKTKNLKYNMKGTINYDTDKSIIEFSGFNLEYTHIESNKVLFYESKISKSVLIGPFLKDCTITRCDLDACGSEDTTFNFTRVKNKEHQYCTFNDCYIDGDILVVDSKIDKGIFRKGNYENCEISDTCNIIDAINLDEEKNK